MEKLNFAQFMFQVTRRCNLMCLHCAKGDSQNMDLQQKHIDIAISQMRKVDNISFVGGETFLAPDIIKYIVNQIQKKKVECYSVFVVTNGTILSREIAETFNDIASYCKYIQLKKNKYLPYSVGIEISKTPYHKNDPNDALEFYKQYCNKNSVSVFVQADNKYNKDMEIQYVMAYSGRAKELSDSFGSASLCYHADIKNNNVQCKIQLNANGSVSLSELVEYGVEDNYSMGLVENESFLNMIHSWNKSYFLDCDNAMKRETALMAIKSGRLDEQDTKEAEEMITKIDKLENNLKHK